MHNSFSTKRRFLFFLIHTLTTTFLPFYQLLLCQSTVNVSAILNSDFSINGNGSSNYSVSIDIPPGINGIVPQLSISYSNQTGNGLMGKGFSLNGILSINRMNANYRDDGFKGGVNYDSNDRFSLGSNKMMKIGGNNNGYFYPGVIYHTKIESWTKIIANGQSGQGPLSFDVTLKSGIRYQFGGTADAQVKAVGPSFKSGPKANSIRKWYINQEVDLNGNTISYVYTQTPQQSNGQLISQAANKGQVYPSEILYNSNPQNNLDAQRIIKFFYETRPDTSAQYVGGGLIKTMARISHIKTYLVKSTNDTQLIRDYKIIYDTSFPVEASRVISISELSSNQILYAMDSFKWTNAPNKVVKNEFNYQTSFTSPGWQGDFNGDGITDIFQITGNSLTSINISNGALFSSINIIPKITLNSLQLVADFNGDGRTDFINGNSSKCSLYLSNGNSLNQAISIQDSVYFPSTINSNTIWTADFNGDGYSDIISKSGNNVYLSFSNGKGFNKFKTVHFPACNGKNGLTSDFNGDGLADLYISDSIYLSNWSLGDSFSKGIYANTSIDENSGFFADFNGDGLGDIVGKSGSKYLLYLSNGYGLEQPMQFSAGDILQSNSWLGDFNGDGMIDFLSNDQGKYGFYYSTGTGFIYSSIKNLNLSTYKWIGDFNGDNIADIFDANSKSLYTNIDSNNLTNYNQLPNLLRSIQNNIGGEIKIQYQPITNSAVYSKSLSSDTTLKAAGIFNIYSSKPLAPQQASSYPIKLIQNAMYVASKYSKSDGRGNIYNYNYTYSGALIDLKGIGWLGFHKVKEIDSLAQNSITTYYNQIYPLTGKSDSIVLQDLNSKYLNVAKNYYSVVNLQNIKNAIIYQVTQSQLNTDYFDYGNYSYSSSIKYEYDYFGNPKLIINIGDKTKLQNTIYTINSYFNDTLNWHIGSLNKNIQSIDSLGKNPLYQTSFLYYPNTYLVKTKSQWLNTSNTWLATNFAYDKYGNRITEIDPANDTTITQYDSIYHTFPNINITARNQWGKTLINQSIYDPGYGKIIGRIDYNGNKFGVILDNFGRDSVLTGPDTCGKQIALELLYYSKATPTGLVITKCVRNNWQGTNWDTSITYSDGLSRNFLNCWNGINQQKIYQQNEFNINNKIVKKSLPYFQGDKILWSNSAYDPYGRIVSVIYPDSIGNYDTTKFSYIGKQVTIYEAVGTIDSSSSSVLYEKYNSNYKIVQLVNKLKQVSLFKYNLLGKDTAATDPGGLTTIQNFNSFGDIIKSFNPASGVQYTNYDYIHRKVYSIDNKGDTITSIYDGLKRPIEQFLGREGKYQYNYDLNNSINGLGNLCQALMNDTSFYYSFNYNPYRQTTGVRLHYSGKDYLEMYFFNPDMSIQQMIYPDMSKTSYSYYNNGLPSSISFSYPKSITPFALASFQSYDAQSRHLLFKFGNNVSTTNTYLPSGKLQQNKIIDAQNEDLIIQDYLWNNCNEITSINDLINNDYSQTFQYDKIGRLKMASGIYGKSVFDYNNSGNLIYKDSLNYIYNNYQVSFGIKSNDTIYKAIYDTKGNLIQKSLIRGKKTNTIKYSFDILNRLKFVIEHGDTLFKFIYDCSGNRIEKYDCKNKIRTLYLGSNYEITQTPDSILSTKYIRSSNNLIATITLSKAISSHSKNRIYHGTPTSGTLYYHQDMVNSSKLTTTSSGQQSSKVLYKPFGDVYQVQGENNIRYTFNSKEQDEIGLYYFNSRYFDPVTTRFISADNRIGGSKYQEGVFNRYSFALNNPVKYSDPTGHEVLDDITILGLLTAEILADVLTDGTATALEAEVDLDFFKALRSSTRAFEESNGEEGLNNEDAIRAYKGRRDAKSNLSDLERTNSNAGNEQFQRPNSYLPRTYTREPGLDTHGNLIFENRSPGQVSSEQESLYAGGDKVKYSSTRLSRNQVFNYINSASPNKPFKFTLSFSDYEISIGLDGECTHAAIESFRGGGYVYTAGSAYVDNGTLILENETGHYATNFSSLKMSDPVWRRLGFNKINYRDFNKMGW